DLLAKAARAAGALGFGGNVVFLKTCAQRVFMPFLEERFPSLVRRYKERFERSAYLRGDYPERIRERVDRIRKRYGFGGRFEERPEPELWPRERQVGLFEGWQGTGIACSTFGKKLVRIGLLPRVRFFRRLGLRRLPLLLRLCVCRGRYRSRGA